MATDLDQGYCGWTREELSDQQDSQESAIAQMLDHGSISFGRFAVESLSWEKRSIFTHNRCQEELEKFKGGLVAQKKAYFEEYYKRIRALKALQENQQTELTLDYGGDGSISSQTGEEDETAGHLESLRDGVTSVISAFSEEPTVEVVLEQERNSSDAPQIRQLDPESAVPYPDSPRRSLEEIVQERNSIDALQIRHLDQESAASDLSRRSLDEIYLKKNSSNALQIRHLAESTEVLSLRRTVEEKPLKNDIINIDGIEIMKKDSSMSTVEAGATVQWTAPDSSMLKPSGSELKMSQDLITEKVKGHRKKNKEHSSISKMKESGASVIRETKLEHRTISDEVKLSQGLKFPLQKMYGNGDKETASRVPNKNKYTSFSSYKPPKDIRPSVTVPRPFSFATEKRITVPTATREGAVQNFNSKASSRSTSSPLHAKRDVSLQHISKKTAVVKGVKSGNVDKKDVKNTSLNTSHRGEAIRKPSVRDGHIISSKGTDGHVHRPKAWSINLPAFDKYSLNGRTESGIRNNIRGNKKKEENKEAGLREFPGSSKPAAPRLARTHRTEIKKIAASQTVAPLLNGKKPRQELKRWR